uniref:GDP-D-glucose phosphorylase 1 n=1 Tax=Heterorhabditis bacteriophora TaxID=37862 RepID=A0A1I7XHP9_HETBA
MLGISVVVPFIACSIYPNPRVVCTSYTKTAVSPAHKLVMRKIIMLGTGPRTQRSVSSVQLPIDFSPLASSVPTFQYKTDDFIIDLRNREDCSSSNRQSLKELIHLRWEGSKAKNAFNYGLNCMYKLLEGNYNLSIQLNVERGELRRKPMRFKNIKEPFNHLRWNFTKLHENERFEPLSDVSNAFIIRPPDWICNAFAFQLTEKENYSTFVSDLTKCVEYLTEQNQAHNLFLTRAQPIRTNDPEHDEDLSGVRPQFVTAYVFPRANMIVADLSIRCTGAKPPTNFNPAANELAGCLTSYTIRFFESVTEQAAVRIIEEEAQLPDDVFQNLVYDISDLLSNKPIGTSRSSMNNLLEDLTSPEIDELRDSFQMFAPHSPNIATNRRYRTNSETSTSVKFNFELIEQ